MKRHLNIVFMGTPEFSIPSLDILIENKYKISAVITAPDKPAGRGKKLRMSAVKEYALQKGLKIMQPSNLKDEGFISELSSLKANLFVIVAFRMLPKAVWDMPEYGSFNLHASLLPQYRGAAPMNWALINGEKETGLTTFFLNERIDTGDIIFQEKVLIPDDMSLGELHDEMKEVGADLVLKTVQYIEKGEVNTKQQSLILDELKIIRPAPKIFREDCKIDWTGNGKGIRNLIRGLDPVPGAYTNMTTSSGEIVQLKIFKSDFIKSDNGEIAGQIRTDNKTYLKVSASDGWLDLFELQIAGKKRMKILEFLRGFDLSKSLIVK